jgi:phosphoglycerate dehydrogenase-like enzyme
VTRVWLPDPPETVASLQPLPDGIEADVWTGGELPGTKDEVEFIVLPMGSKPALLDAITKLPRLKVIQLLSAGAEQVVGHVPAGITLCNARGAHDAATAEWTVGAIVASIRNFPRFVRAQEAGEWDFAVSESVAGKRVLIVGYGSIGAAVERRLAGFEVTVRRVARSPREGVVGLAELPALLPAADVVVLLVPFTPETAGMVDADFLARMKDGALLVNAARGPVVVTEALCAELASGRLRAALDVTDPEPLPPGHPLWTLPGVFITPHVGASTPVSQRRVVQLAREQAEAYLRGEELRNVISGTY